MPQYIITPWRNNSELLQVRKEFYGDNSEPDDKSRRHAVDWVAAWRMRGSLPHAIESTAAIVDAQLHQNGDHNSPFSIRATYAAAVSRFVTGYCDITQNSAIRRSMYDVATEIGLPASFVELRHEATHSDLPSLQRLERHAKLALQWLWTQYWSKLDKQNHPRTEPTEVQLTRSKAEITSILTRFVAERRREIRNGTDALPPATSTATAKALIEVTLGRPRYLGLLCHELCREKMLVPAGRKPSDSMKGAYMLWDELLLRLSASQRRFQHVLLGTLTALVNDADKEILEAGGGFQDGVTRWIVHLLGEAPWSARTSDRDRVSVICSIISSAPRGLQLTAELLQHTDQVTREACRPLLAVT